jgi:hypothetical protein
MITPGYYPALYDTHSWRPTITDLWKYLKIQCSLTCGPNCRTHIIVGFYRSYNLKKLKQIARAIIYFEPAFEDLLPKYRRGNIDAKSNGSRMRKAFGNEPLVIENAKTEYDVVKLMQCFRNDRSEDVHDDEDLFDQEYVWNFSQLRSNRRIEFRNAPACASGEETLRWAELVFSFVNAAFQTPSSELEGYSNGIGGLWAYMESFFVPVVNEPGRMAVLWDEARRRQGGGEQIRKGKREQG